MLCFTQARESCDLHLQVSKERSAKGLSLVGGPSPELYTITVNLKVKQFFADLLSFDFIVTLLYRPGYSYIPRPHHLVVFIPVLPSSAGGCEDPQDTCSEW